MTQISIEIYNTLSMEAENDLVDSFEKFDGIKKAKRETPPIGSDYFILITDDGERNKTISEIISIQKTILEEQLEVLKQMENELGKVRRR